jgi:threonine dehydratase
MYPKLKDIREAAERIKPHAIRTEVLTSSYLNDLTGADLYFKCENFQKAGAFKFRGACNSVLKLSDEQAKNGVATHSSGNHGQALALATKLRGIPSYIVVPATASKVKIEAIKHYQGQMTFCAPTLADREKELNKILEETNATQIHPYDNWDTIEGQVTSALELLQDHPHIDILITPVGGGGLLSGTAIAGKGINPDMKIFAAEPEGADDAIRSMEAGKIITSENPRTICDGLLTSLGEMNFKVIQDKVDRIFSVNDDEIINAMKLIYERMKIIVETNCATVLAAILKYPKDFKDKKVGLIITGGNVDIHNLPF